MRSLQEQPHHRLHRCTRCQSQPITPLFPESLATVAVKGWGPFTVTFAVLPDNVTALGAAPAVTMIVATADFVASATDVAVSWTIAMAGTIPGAL